MVHGDRVSKLFILGDVLPSSVRLSLPECHHAHGAMWVLCRVEKLVLQRLRFRCQISSDVDVRRSFIRFWRVKRVIDVIVLFVFATMSLINFNLNA